MRNFICTDDYFSRTYGTFIRIETTLFAPKKLRKRLKRRIYGQYFTHTYGTYILTELPFLTPYSHQTTRRL